MLPPEAARCDNAGRIAGKVNRNFWRIGLAILSAGMIHAATPALEEALARVRQNVQAFETQIPDFVCAEKITSRNVADKDGRVERETIIESTFSGRQKHTAATAATGTSFTEERRIEKVNGQKWSGNAMPPGVFQISGGYSSLIVMIFGSQGAENYSFSLVDGAIGFATKNGKQKIVEKDGLHSFKATGRAWFDPQTFEVVRIEEQIEPKGGELGSSLPVMVEYKPVRIGENQFYLPSRVSASARRTVSGKAERGEFVAEYSNYRKYGSSSTIQFPDADK
jgi:hypothetical protein